MTPTKRPTVDGTPAQRTPLPVRKAVRRAAPGTGGATPSASAPGPSWERVGLLLRLGVALAEGPMDTGWQLRRCADAVLDVATLDQPDARGRTDVACALVDDEACVVTVGLPSDEVGPRPNRLAGRLDDKPAWLAGVVQTVHRRATRPLVAPLSRLTDAPPSIWLTASTVAAQTMVTLVDTAGTSAHRPMARSLRLLHTHHTRLIDDDASLHAPLQPRLAITLDHLLTGMSEAQIAEAVHRSPHTVHANVKALYRKFGVGSRAALMAKFISRRPPRT